jgi:hypothetical protein
MKVAVYAWVSTRDKVQNPETQLREHVHDQEQVVGECVDHAGPVGSRCDTRRSCGRFRPSENGVDPAELAGTA